MSKIIPGVGVDDVMFEMDADSLISLGYVERPEFYSEILNWKTYIKNEGVECYVYDNKVISIACFGNCSIFNFELIGRHPDDVSNELGQPDEVGEPVWVTDDTQQTPYEYDALGLQIWVESGVVISVFCNVR
jgi:hypothetical protein